MKTSVKLEDTSSLPAHMQPSFYKQPSNNPTPKVTTLSNPTSNVTSPTHAPSPAPSQPTQLSRRSSQKDINTSLNIALDAMDTLTLPHTRRSSISAEGARRRRSIGSVAQQLLQQLHITKLTQDMRPPEIVDHGITELAKPQSNNITTHHTTYHRDVVSQLAREHKTRLSRIKQDFKYGDEHIEMAVQKLDAQVNIHGDDVMRRQLLMFWTL